MVPPEGYDGTLWAWQLLANDDRRRQVLVGISGTTMAMAAGALSDRISLARTTSGRSEVERVLEWPEPPAEIKVDCESVQHFGSDAGPQLGP